GAEVDVKGRGGQTALFSAARPSFHEMNPPKGQPPRRPRSEVLRLLLDRGAKADATDDDGRTPLMFANSAAKVKLLVACGAVVNAADKWGETALMKAATAGDVEVVQALLDGGADVNARDPTGATALLHALAQERGHRPKPSEGYAKVARLLLLANGV